MIFIKVSILQVRRKMKEGILFLLEQAYSLKGPSVLKDGEEKERVIRLSCTKNILKKDFKIRS